MTGAAEAKNRTLAEKLFEGISDGDAAAVDEAIKQGADANGALDGVSPLAYAVKYNRSTAVEALAKAGADLKAVDAQGRTALYLAVEENQVGAMTALIKAGADVDKAGPEGHTPRTLAAANKFPLSSLSMAFGEALEARGRIELCQAIEKDDMEALKRILASSIVKDLDRPPAPREMTPLMLTIRENNAEAMALLLEAGAKANVKSWDGETPLSYVIAHYMENPRLAALLLAHGANPNEAPLLKDAPLLEAAKKGQEAVVRLLIAANANIQVTNSSGENAAHMAAVGNHAEIISLLAAAGISLNAKNRQGQTPLDAAVMAKSRGVFDALLDAGADPKITGKDGMTTLMSAGWSGDAGVIPELVARGVPLDAKREGDGFTALHFAAFRGKTAAAKQLLDAGADYTLTTDDGRTALQVARERCCEEVAALIIEKMGDEALTGLRQSQTFRKPLRFKIPGS